MSGRRRGEKAASGLRLNAVLPKLAIDLADSMMKQLATYVVGLANGEPDTATAHEVSTVLTAPTGEQLRVTLRLDRLPNGDPDDRDGARLH